MGKVFEYTARNNTENLDMSTQGKTDLVPVSGQHALELFDAREERDRAVITRLQDAMEKQAPYFWSSLPNDTRDEKVKVYQALSRNVNDIDDILTPRTFACKDAIITRIAFTNEKGERVLAPKVVMVGPSGELCSVIAPIWCEQFISLFNTFGLPPWDEPLMVSSKLNKGQGASRYYTLELQG